MKIDTNDNIFNTFDLDTCCVFCGKRIKDDEGYAGKYFGTGMSEWTTTYFDVPSGTAYKVHNRNGKPDENNPSYDSCIYRWENWAYDKFIPLVKKATGIKLTTSGENYLKKGYDESNSH